jgi:hypothetical protein
MYFTDRGIEELAERRGGEQVALGWLAERLRDFVDEHPDAESLIDSLASWLARLDDDDDETSRAFGTDAFGSDVDAAAGTDAGE